jgi:hypothetical protein
LLLLLLLVLRLRRLESLSLTGCGAVAGIDLQLPELKRLFIEHVQVNMPCAS